MKKRIAEKRTEQREDDKLQQLKLEALGQLASGIAHDFNNILSIVEGYAKIAMRSQGDTDEFEHCMDKILNATKRGAALTRQLLSFGRKKLAVEKIESLQQAVLQQAELLKPLLGARYDLKFDIEPKDLYILSHPDLIGQILTNLCINARDAMPNGGKITISVQPDQNTDDACLIVTDEGCGIAPEIANHIFDPFFTTKPLGQGTGLGLSMIYGLVQQVGGNMSVESIQGQGSRFIVRFPLLDTPSQEKEKKPSTDFGDVSLIGKTLLLVEDEEDLRAVLVKEFSRYGLSVFAAEDGKKAIDLAAHIPPPDFVLSDMIMPEMTGEIFGQKIAALCPKAHIFYMSGYPERGQTKSLPDDLPIILKPLDIEKFIPLLQHITINEQ